MPHDAVSLSHTARRHHCYCRRPQIDGIPLPRVSGYPLTGLFLMGGGLDL